jgi:hypothetical protein
MPGRKPALPVNFLAFYRHKLSFSKWHDSIYCRSEINEGFY